MSTKPPCQCCGNDPAELYCRLDEFIASLDLQPRDPRRKGHLIKILHHAQKLFGHLPAEVQKHVAARMNLHHADISGVISFYNHFTTTPRGKYDISVCMGTACYVKGADKVLAEFEKQLGLSSGEVSEDALFSVQALRCVGACGLAPVVMVNDKVYGRVEPKDVQGILNDYRNKGIPENE